MWTKTITHDGLHTYRVVRGTTQQETEVKARLQLEAWNERWKSIQDAAAARQDRLTKRDWADRQSDLDRRAKDHAIELTKDAEAAILAARSLLASALKGDPSFEWESLKDNTAFDKPQPSMPAPQTLPAEPLRTEPQYTALPFRATIKFVDWIVPGARRKKLVSAQTEEARRNAEVQDKYLRAHAQWKQRYDEISQQNLAALSNHEKAKATWLLGRHAFLEQQKLFNLNIGELQEQYLSRNPDALIRYWSEIIERSEYPDTFPRDHVLSFDSQAGILVLDYELPPEAAVPKKKLVRYVAQRKEFQDVFISDSEFRRLYDDVLYQICLRTLHELFRADELNVITSIVFNGWVHAVNKATGADTHPCIMTVQAAKADFLALNLHQIDLKTCFRSLKGVSGGRLVDFSPVRPVLSLDKNDPRFVGAYGVADSLDDKTNLAAMDWLDFENLIREVFEKEFSKNGGEVKITQASRDGGVKRATQKRVRS